MKVSLSTVSLLKRLWLHLSPSRRRQFCFLLFLMFAASLAEIISIGAVFPFLAVLTEPDKVFNYPLAQPFITWLGLKSSQEILFPITLVFGLAAVLAGGVRLLLLWFNARLSYATGAEVSINMYRKALYQPYAVHCARNSSEIINSISSKAGNTINVIGFAINILSSSVMLIAILVAILSVNPMVAISAFVCFGLIYLIIIRLTKGRLAKNSILVARESTNVIKCLQEGLGGIRDVLIDGNQEVYCKIYRNADAPLRRAQANNLFMGLSPRYGMEAFGMLLIAMLAYSLAITPDSISKAIPTLGAIALGAQRLLPIMQQGYSAFAGIQGGKESLKDTVDLLDQPLPHFINQPISEPLPFNEAIVLKNLSFKYASSGQDILKDITLRIEKGSRVGFVGSTGSGKSTLLDIIMGLLEPSSGVLKVDDEVLNPNNLRGWQSHIAHVPQVIFLTDATIEENIALGVPSDEIDHSRVRDAAKQAQISDLIEGWPEKYQTFVGERGVRLSGGQRQRIGIARALYKRAEVIIFDEATSALDSETETAVMDSINGLSKNLTILIVAHRLTTLKNCTNIVELSDGMIKRIGKYDEILH